MTIAGDERAKLLDSGGVSRQSILDERGYGLSFNLIARSVVAATPVLYEINLGERRIESGSKLGTGSNASGALLAPQLKPVIGERDEKCAAKSYECDEYRGFYDSLLIVYAIAMPYWAL